MQLTSTAPTTAATTTTNEATTTTEDPATAYERDVAEITEVLFGMHDYLINHGAVIDIPVLSAYHADPLLQRKITNIELLIEQGIEVGEASYEIHVIKIEIEGNTATSLSCNHDKVSLVSITGTTVIPPDATRFLIAETYRLTPDGWRMTDSAYFNGEPTECEV